MSASGDRRLSGQRGIVGLNLALTIAFALFAVIELSRVTLAAKQIDDRVERITTDVGPGSNVSQLDETEKLNDVAQKAEDILKAAQPLSGQAQTILDTAKSIDSTVSNILTNAEAINGSVNSINSTASALLPVVQSIHGTGGKGGGGVEAINIRASEAVAPVAGIQGDLARVIAQAGPAGPGGHVAGTIHASANGINCAVVLLPNTGCGA
jgi:methyl-accepting chemotaxis protein